MGCDIHSYAERKVDGKWEMVAGLHPFDWRSYGMFGFLAGIRNYSAVPQIAPQRGLPEDLSADVRDDAESWNGDGHSHSWISVDELLSFDYDKQVEDRRVTRQIGQNAWDGGCTADPGGGEMTTFREFLGEGFFDDLAKLKTSGAGRVVFWFDN